MIIWFLIISFLNLISIIFDIQWLGIISKPLIIPALAFYFLKKTSFNLHKPNNYIFLALVFSFVGDVMLMFTQISFNFFIAGLLSFLIAHLFYILCFYRLSIDSGNKLNLITIKSLFVIAYLVAFLYILIPNMDSILVFPGVVYSLTIGTMLAISLALDKCMSKKNYWMLIGGAMLFVISDSMIAFNKFYHEFATASFFIMLSYIIAQFLIISALLKHDRLLN